MIGAVAGTSRMELAWVCSSPDSWWRRFNVDNASLKSERFLNGPVFPDLLREIHQFCLYRKYCFRHVMKEILVRKFVHLDTDLFSSIMFELRCTKIRIVPFSNYGQHSVLFVLCFPTSVAMRSSLLNHVVWNWEVPCILNDASVGCTFFQEMPACAIDDALTPVW